MFKPQILFGRMGVVKLFYRPLTLTVLRCTNGYTMYTTDGTKISLFLSPVSAGFPGVVSDSIDKKLNLHEYCVKHPSATFFVKVEGFSMINAGIDDGDILVVDRSLDAKNRSIVLAVVNGMFTVKRFLKNSKGLYLYPENSRYRPVKISENTDFEIWGVVTNVIKTLI